MNPSQPSSAGLNNRPRFLGALAAVASFGVTVVALYALAGQPNVSGAWLLMAALGYLVPITLANACWGWRAGIGTALAGALTIVLLVWGVETGFFPREPGFSAPLASLGVAAAILPGWACLLFLLRRMQHDQEVTEQLKLSLREPKVSHGPDRRENPLVCLAPLGNAFQLGKTTPEVLGSMVRAIAEGTGYSRVLVALTNDEGSLLQYVEGTGFPSTAIDALQSVRYPLSIVQELVREDLAVGPHSYYVSGEHKSIWSSTVRACISGAEAGGGEMGGLLIVPILDWIQPEREKPGSGEEIRFLAEMIGVITIGPYPGGQRPEPATVEVVETFAQHAAVMVANLRLYDGLQRQMENLLLINQVGQSVAAGLECGNVLDAMVAASAELLGGEWGLLLLWEERNEQLKPQATYSCPARDRAWFEEKKMVELINLVVRDGRLILVPEISADPRFEDSPGRPSDLRSLIVIPLVKEPLKGLLQVGQIGVSEKANTSSIERPKVIGVLVLGSRRPRAFDLLDPLLLSTLADQASVAVQSAELYHETARHVQDLYSLYEVGKQITSTLDVEGIIRLTAEQTRRLTDAASSKVILVDERTERLTQTMWCGPEECRPYACTYEQARQGLSGWVIKEKAAAISADVSQDERMQGVDVELCAGQGAGSMIAAPLLIDGELVGVVDAVRMQGTPPFSARELGLLNMLASQTSLAITNARSFADRRRQIVELSILNQTGQALSSTLKLDDLLELIYHQVVRVMEARSFYVALYDPDREIISFPIAYVDGVRRAGPGIEAPWEATEVATTRAPNAEATGVATTGIRNAEWLPRPVWQELAGHVIQTKRALWLPHHIPRRLAEMGFSGMSGDGARSWIGVPVLADEQVLGVVAVQVERNSVSGEETGFPGGSYDEEHLELLMTIASQASAAMRNVRLFAEVTRITENLERLVAERTGALAMANRELTVERDRLNTLYEIARELSRSIELERVLARTLALINRALDAEQGYILVRDSGGQGMEYKAVVGYTAPSADGQGFRSPMVGEKRIYREDDGLVGWLISHRESISIGDLPGDGRWHIVEGQERWHRSVLAGPLLSGEEFKGALLLYHSQPHHFTADHQRMFEAIASQLGTTVSGVEMFSLLTEAAGRLGTMLRGQQLEAAKSQAILEGVADGVMVTDAGGEITLFNAAAERILQVSRFEVIGHSEADLPGLFSLAGTSWAELTRRWGGRQTFSEATEVATTVAAGEELFHEEQLEIDGRTINVRIAPVKRRDMFEGTVAVFRDISKDVEVDRMKSEFVSMVSHELRTPMTSIKGYIDLVYSGMAGPLNEMQSRFLQTVKNNADRLTMLVNSLVEISSLDSGELNLALETVDPLRVVNGVIQDCMPKAVAKGHTLEAQLAEPLPAVHADPERLAQVLTRLVDNAIHYTPDGGRVTVGGQVRNGFVHLYVRDTGIGISEEDQKKLFERFFRADDPLVQQHSGTGLGLFIAKSIVELHGGEMWVDSKPGEGSTFTFSLPLALQESGAVFEYEFKTISYRAQDKHILVVEDEADIANLIAYQLRSRGGYRVHVARYGRDALDYLASGQTRVDLVTLDLRLPDMNGLEVLRTIKNHRTLCHLPVVVVSVLPGEHEGYLLGASAYLSKPIESSQLLSTIETLLVEKTQVLVVEDDAILAEVFQAALEESGFTATIEAEGQRVFDRVKEEQPGLILLDIKLPGMNGYQVLAKLKSVPETCSIPVVVVTGSLSDAEDKRQQILDMGAAQFLTKPLNVEGLVGEIQRILAGQNSGYHGG